MTRLVFDKDNAGCCGSMYGRGWAQAGWARSSHSHAGKILWRGIRRDSDWTTSTGQWTNNCSSSMQWNTTDIPQTDTHQSMDEFQMHYPSERSQAPKRYICMGPLIYSAKGKHRRTKQQISGWQQLRLTAKGHKRIVQDDKTVTHLDCSDGHMTICIF